MFHHIFLAKAKNGWLFQLYIRIICNTRYFGMRRQILRIYSALHSGGYLLSFNSSIKTPIGRSTRNSKTYIRASPFGIRIIRARRNHVSVFNIQHDVSDKTVTETKMREITACRNCIFLLCILPYCPQKIVAGQETQNEKRRWKTKWLLPTATTLSTPMPARL